MELTFGKKYLHNKVIPVHLLKLILKLFVLQTIQKQNKVLQYENQKTLPPWTIFQTEIYAVGDREILSKGIRHKSIKILQ